ncbi:glutathione S-transferase [Lentithecium fluviatile CBS 122367]|uniref:Glutathione S-transferase n=1 Tax=Lentithecium fluviatile CBS 122367 TaxID=1168545 RepID=A0A6G1IV92_9PLEO|nr:glutathione S-transferase [Lentithecium fluviatile CBS 122367]
MSPKIHLFLAPGACSLAPHILLQEIGIPFKTTTLRVEKRFPEEYLQLNPKGQVPFLHLDSETITENPAILTAIAQIDPSKHLLGKTDIEKVRCYEWMNWISGKLHGQAFGSLFRPQRYVKDEALYDAVRERSKETIAECYQYIEEKLGERKWAVGDDFTAADAYLFVFYRWGGPTGFSMKERFPNYTRLAEQVVKRGAVSKAAEEEGITLLGNKHIWD